MKNEIQQKLEQIALNRSIPFCYGCYKRRLPLAAANPAEVI